MKSYTDIEQSKKLAEILPIESADMAWCNDEYRANLYTVKEMKDTFDAVFNGWNKYWELIPCWSLSSLLDMLPTLDERNPGFCKDVRCDKWHVYYHSTATLSIIDTERYDNIIDACYEMILKLHKQKLL